MSALHRLGLVAVLGLSALFNLVNLARNGYANNFYSAADRSMLDSLHNLLFVSFDPGGLISVDKPPLAMWLQVASAKIFGFGPLSLLMPQALAGVATVGVLYLLVRRAFGARAALLAATALALFPCFVAVSRDNLPDPLLILLMTLACGACLRAIEAASVRSLAVCAALIGLAFNTKTLAAYLLVPAIAGAYLLCAPLQLRRSFMHLLAAGAVLAAVSVLWLALVDLTPAAQRPYVGGSLDNSEFGLTFAYNGLGRLDGQEGAPGHIPYRPGAALIVASGPQAAAAQAIYPALGHGLAKLKSEPGPAGPLRLFNSALGTQGAWLAPLGLLGLLGLLIEQLGRLRSGAIARSDRRLALLIVFGGWLACEAIVLSFAGGIIHPYYVSALAPGMAVLFGLAITRLATGGPLRRFSALALLLGVEATLAVQALLLLRAHYMRWLAYLLIACGALIGASRLYRLAISSRPQRRSAFKPALLRLPGRFANVKPRNASAMALGCLLLIAPGAWAATTWQAPVQGTFPAAGPHAAAGPGGTGLYPEERSYFSDLAGFLRAHRLGSRFAVLSVSSVTAAPLILMGLRAAALAGYGGVDPALDAHELAGLVARGQARYVLLGGAYSERGGNGASAAVLRACALVPQQAWNGPKLEPYSLTLFDCRGRAAAIAAPQPPR